MLLLPTAVLAAGMEWLDHRANADGSYGHVSDIATTFQSTTETLRLYQASGRLPPAGIGEALRFVDEVAVETTEFLARKIIVRAQTGDDVSGPLNQLLTRQGPDGGFGELPGYPSTVLDTAFALQALSATHSFDSAAGLAVGYLFRAQHPDGSWGDAQGVASVYPSALVVQALTPYRSRYRDTGAVIAAGVTHLLGQRDERGYWDEDFLTAQALLALAPNLVDLNSIRPGVEQLREAQMGDGSWGGDVYVTAVALRALRVVEAAGADPSLSSLSGSVTDAQTGLPLSGVTVTLSGPLQATRSSDSHGDFGFQQLPQGDYRLEFQLADYVTVTTAVSLAAGQVMSLTTVSLSKGPSPATGTIRGTFTHAGTGAPLPGVTVTVAETGQRATTDSDGHYQIANVPAGTLTLAAARAGYSQANASTRLSAGGLALFSAPLTPVDRPVTAIAGVVLDGRTGEPVAGATITLSGASALSAVSDANGAYYIEGLNSGTHELQVSAPGYEMVSATARVYAHNILTYSPRLYPSGGSDIDDNGAIIRGVVVAAGSDLPIAAAQITATLPAGMVISRSDSAGAFIVPAGESLTAELQVSAPGYATQAIAVSFAPGADVDLGRLRLRPEDHLQLLPDLAVTAIDPVALSSDVHSLRVTGEMAVVIRNAGSETAPAGVSVEAFHDTDHSGGYRGGMDNLLAHTTLTEALLPGQETRQVLSLDGYLPFRDAPLSVALDSDQRLIELDEANNVVSHYRRCQDGAELREAVDLSAAALHVVGQPVSLKLRVGNAGVIVAPAGTQVAFYEGDPASGGVLLGVKTLDAIAANESLDVELQAPALVGNLPLYAVVDSADAVSECSESNNSVSIPGPALHPDLVPMVSDTAMVMSDPQTLAVSGRLGVNVANRGTRSAPAGVTVLAFYDVDGDGRFAAHTDPVLGETATIEATAAGADTSLAIPLSGMLPYRDAPVSVWVDSDELIAESNEANNVDSSASLCHGEPPEIGQIDPVQKWRWHREKVLTIPLVGPLLDTDGDGDIDTDDDPIVVFGSHSGFVDGSQARLRAVNGVTGEEVWAVTDSALLTEGSAHPALGDIDGDGIPEVVMYLWRGGVAAINNDGTLKWSTSAPPDPGRYNYGGISLADLEGDGRVEILARDHVLNSDGSVRWVAPDSASHVVISYAADLDMDGVQEVIMGSRAYRADGSDYWDNSDKSTALSAVANFDDDDFPEMVAKWNDAISLLDHDGSLLWNTPVPGGGGGAPTIADMDGDGLPEIGVAGRSNYVVYNHDGSILWTRRTQDFSSKLTGSTVFDFNGDGRAEVIYADEVRLRVYDGASGDSVYEINNGSWTATEYPIVADIDGDDHAELLVVGDKSSSTWGIRAFEDANDSWVPTRRIWNQHLYHIDNINDDGTIPAQPAYGWLSHNSFRLNAFPERGALDQPDLSVGQLRLIDNGFGNPLTLRARVGNAGAADTTAPVTIAFYDGDPMQGGVLLGRVSTDALGAGESRDLTLDGIAAISGSGQLFGMVDPDDVFVECIETNNTVGARPGLASTGALSVDTDAIVYGPDSQVELTATVGNTSALVGNFMVRLSIEDEGGNTVIDLAPQAVMNLAAGDQSLVINHWNTDALLAGRYRLRGVLALADGTELDVATTPFDVVHGEASTAAADLRITTDRPLYHTSATVQLEALARNQTTNTIIDDAVLRLSVTDPSGQQIHAADLTLGQLGIAAQRQAFSPYSLQSAAEGSYAVHGELWAGNRRLAVDTTDFQVSHELSQALSGQVALAHVQIYVGEPQTCTTVVTNAGSAAAEGLSLRRLLVNLDQGAELQSQSFDVNLAPQQSFSGDHAMSVSPTAAGGYACVLQVRLAGRWQRLASAVFTVLPNPNIAPRAHAGADQRVRPGDRVILDGSASSDVDGDALNYRWRQIGRPAASAATLDDPGAVMPAFAVDAPGSYVFQLVVNDGQVDSAPDTVIVDTENVAPVARAGPDRQVLPGEPVPLDGSASTDVDGDRLSFHWRIIQAPLGSTASLDDPEEVTPSMAVDLDGRYLVELVVSDGTLQSVPDTLVLSSGNLAPRANAGDDRRVAAGDTVVLDGSASTDPNDDLLSYRWSMLQRPVDSLAALANATGVNPTLNLDRSGLYIVQLVVNDGRLDSPPDTVVINVDNIRPLAHAGPDQVRSAGEWITLDGSGSVDGDGDALVYRWSFTRAPDGASPLVENSEGMTARYHGDIAGRYISQLLVSDGRLTSAPDTAVITVRDDVGPRVNGLDHFLPAIDSQTAVSLSAVVDDARTGGAHIAAAEMRIGEGPYHSMQARDGGFDAVAEEVVIDLPAFNQAGMHRLCVRGRDVLGNTGAEVCALLPVYDADGGFVTGGGWLHSTPDACRPADECGAIGGRSNFGFNIRYKKRAALPSGHLNFVIKDVDLHFTASHFDWLVVKGPRASFKGKGSVNGGGEFGFLVTVVDAADGDRFRLRIWEIDTPARVIFDNAPEHEVGSAAGTALGGGSIVIHGTGPGRGNPKVKGRGAK